MTDTASKWQIHLQNDNFSIIMLIRVVDNDRYSYTIRSIRGVDFFSSQHLFFKLHLLKMIAPFLKNDKSSIIMLIRVVDNDK